MPNVSSLFGIINTWLWKSLSQKLIVLRRKISFPLKGFSGLPSFTWWNPTFSSGQGSSTRFDHLATPSSRPLKDPCANLICPSSARLLPRFTVPSHLGISTSVCTFVPQLWHCARHTVGIQERFAKLSTKYNEIPRMDASLRKWYLYLPYSLAY